MLATLKTFEINGGRVPALSRPLQLEQVVVRPLQAFERAVDASALRQRRRRRRQRRGDDLVVRRRRAHGLGLPEARRRPVPDETIFKVFDEPGNYTKTC